MRGDDGERDEYLRPGACVACLHAHTHFSVEYSRDSVRFRQERRVAETQGRAQADAEHATRQQRRLGNQEERHDVGQEDAEQENVAELASGCADDGRVFEAVKHEENEESKQNS